MKLTPSVQSGQSKTSNAPKRRPPGKHSIRARDVGALFDALKASFPMWNIESSEQNVSLWMEELALYTVDDLRRAYKSIVNHGGKSPPSLPEIVVLCRGSFGDAQSRQGDPIDATAIDGPKITKKKAAANVDRLKRILAGVELPDSGNYVTGHLSNAMKRRLEESINGFPTFKGYVIDPKYIRNESRRTDYIKEIDEWREANV